MLADASVFPSGLNDNERAARELNPAIVVGGFFSAAVSQSLMGPAPPDANIDPSGLNARQ